MRSSPIHLAGAALLLTAAAQAAEADGIAFFEAKIRPLLVERCDECHGEKKQKGGLRLDSRAAWEKGGESGAVIVPGDPDTSLLIKAVRYLDKDLQMPPKRQLAEAEIAALQHWVQIGAPDPREAKGAVARTRKEVDSVAGRKHWAFQPVAQSPAPPPVFATDSWSRQDLDRFIYARLQEAGLPPSAPADRRTLIRRATFDLTGLPPTVEEVAAFVQDSSPEAFARVVDRLLASPHYGEHWARHWLDVARYSDTKGYVYAREEKQFVHAWAYRDWVVRALNEDLPYDRFLLLQLAADQVEPAGSPNLAAMGFLTLGRRFLGVTHDIIDDRIDVVMRGTQGLTVACARCHDHKFDPIATRDYYALYGVFQSCAEHLVPCAAPAEDAAFEKELRTREEKLRTTLAQRREEQSARVRAMAAEHLVAQLELEKYPEEIVSQILGPNDINPVFVRRWQRCLAEADQRHDPIFAAWHAFAKAKPESFGQIAGSAWHPLVAQAFATPPASMREVAERYGALFADAEKQWRELLKSDATAQALPDARAEDLRRVLYGPDSPCTVPDEDYINIEWFFPNATTVELWKVQNEVDRWLIQSAQAPRLREHPRRPRETLRAARLQARQSADQGRGRSAAISPGAGRRPARALRARQRTARSRAGHHRAGQSADGARDGQPGVDAAFRPRTREHPERLWGARGPAEPSRAPRLAGTPVHGRGLEPQEPASPPHALRNVSAEFAGVSGERRHAPGAGARPGEPSALAHEHPPVELRGNARRVVRDDR